MGKRVAELMGIFDDLTGALLSIFARDAGSAAPSSIAALSGAQVSAGATTAALSSDGLSIVDVAGGTHALGGGSTTPGIAIGSDLALLSNESGTVYYNSDATTDHVITLRQGTGHLILKGGTRQLSVVAGPSVTLTGTTATTSGTIVVVRETSAGVFAGSVTSAATSIGPFATLAALVAALPPSTTTQGQWALVGAAFPYIYFECDGVAWNMRTRKRQQWNDAIQTPDGYQGGNTDKAPSFGSVSHFYRNTRKGARVFANFDLAANITLTGGGSPTKTDATDTTAPYGTTAVQIAAPGGFTNCTIAQTAILQSAGVDVRNGFFRLRIKTNSGNNSNGVSLRIYSGGTPGTPGGNYIQSAAHSTQFIDSLTQGSISFHPGDGVTLPTGWSLVGTATLADLQTAKWCQVIFPASGAGYTATIGCLDWVPNRRSKAAVIFGFDDARPDQWTVAAPVLHKYGFPAVLYSSPAMSFSPEGNSTLLNVRQMKILNEHFGWQHACQAGATENTTITTAWSDEEFAADCQLAKSILAGIGATGAIDGSWYSGVDFKTAGPTGTPRRDIMRKFYRTVRAYRSTLVAGLPETWPLTDPMKVPGVNFTTYTDAVNRALNLSTAQGYCADAALAKGVVVFVTHNLTSYNGSFDDLCAWLDAPAQRAIYDVCTLDDLFNGPQIY